MDEFCSSMTSITPWLQRYWGRSLAGLWRRRWKASECLSRGVMDCSCVWTHEKPSIQSQVCIDFHTQHYSLKIVPLSVQARRSTIWGRRVRPWFFTPSMAANTRRFGIRGASASRASAWALRSRYSFQLLAPRGVILATQCFLFSFLMSTNIIPQ